MNTTDMRGFFLFVIFAINHTCFYSVFFHTRVTQMDGCEDIKMNNCMKQQMAEAEAETRVE